MDHYKIFAFADEADAQIDGQIRAMVRNGLDGLEIRGVDGCNISEISMEKAKEVRRKLTANGLSVWSIGSPIGKIPMDGDFDAHKELFRHTLEVAEILGAGNIRMFSFFMPEADCEKNRQAVIDRLGQLLEIARDTGIRLCHENEKGIYGATAKRCLELHKALPELKAVFDPANFVQCGEDTRKAWQLLDPYISYLHIKDSRTDGTVVPAGKGAGNIAYIVRKFLESKRYALTLEPHLTVFEGLKDLEEEGNTSGIDGSAYATAEEAFDAGCVALRTILKGV